MSEPDDDTPKISREEAKQLIEDASHGRLILADIQPAPAIGDVPPEEREYEIDTRAYRFGEVSLDD